MVKKADMERPINYAVTVRGEDVYLYMVREGEVPIAFSELASLLNLTLGFGWEPAFGPARGEASLLEGPVAYDQGGAIAESAIRALLSWPLDGETMQMLDEFAVFCRGHEINACWCLGSGVNDTDEYPEDEGEQPRESSEGTSVSISTAPLLGWDSFRGLILKDDSILDRVHYAREEGILVLDGEVTWEERCFLEVWGLELDGDGKLRETSTRGTGR